MPNLTDMLDAHVQFELNSWTGDRLSQTLTDEASALYGWLQGVRLNEVVNEAGIDALLTVVCETPLSAELAEVVSGVVRSAHAAALEDGTVVGELMSRDDYGRLADTVISLEEIRREITAQVTTSEVYSQLMAHVLYQGIKNYLQTENVIAKKVPGASTLMRLGQNAVNTAAPKLEKSIDRQLTAFVNANIADTIRDSRHYLDKVLDAEVLGAVAGEVWATNAESAVADIARLVPADSLEELVVTGWNAGMWLRATPTFREFARLMIVDFLAANGNRTFGSFASDAGIDEAVATDLVVELATPVVQQAVDDGYLEERIRARLEPFYASYDADGAGGTSKTRRKPKG